MNRKHFCPDWDYMEVSEHDPEIEHCLCEPKWGTCLECEGEGYIRTEEGTEECDNCLAFGMVVVQ